MLQGSSTTSSIEVVLQARKTAKNHSDVDRFVTEHNFGRVLDRASGPGFVDRFPVSASSSKRCFEYEPHHQASRRSRRVAGRGLGHVPACEFGRDFGRAVARGFDPAHGRAYIRVLARVFDRN